MLRSCLAVAVVCAAFAVLSQNSRVPTAVGRDAASWERGACVVRATRSREVGSYETHDAPCAPLGDARVGANVSLPACDQDVAGPCGAAEGCCVRWEATCTGATAQRDAWACSETCVARGTTRRERVRKTRIVREVDVAPSGSDAAAVAFVDPPWHRAPEGAERLPELVCWRAASGSAGPSVLCVETDDVCSHIRRWL